MHVLDVIGRSLADGGGMFWETLWALVLGFGLSGAVQAFVSRDAMQRGLGDHRPDGRDPGLALRHGVARRAPTPRRPWPVRCSPGARTS